MTSIPVTVVIGSAGRRLYLIDWFRKAFETLGVEGRVVVTENDETSSSATYGDIGRIMPKYSDPAYETALLDLIVDLEPQLFISVNDYELLHLHVNTDLADRMRQLGVLVPGVSAEWQRGCVDKLRMAQMLAAIGVRTAPTVTGGDAAGLSALAAYTDDVVVKHRFGSGSSGLAIVSAARAEEAVAESLLSAPAQSGGEPTADDVVIQPKLSGTEHGVDIVGALHAPGDLAAVLASGRDGQSGYGGSCPVRGEFGSHRESGWAHRTHRCRHVPRRRGTQHCHRHQSALRRRISIRASRGSRCPAVLPGPGHGQR